MRGFEFQLSLALGVLGLGLAATASAVPLTYTVLPSSTLSGDIVGTLSVTVVSNVGTFPGSGNVSGSLSSTPTGSITADWGSPGWNNQIDLTGININNPNPGLVTGPLGISVPILGTLGFNLTINVSNISLSLANPTSTIPLPPEVSPGPGPWTAIFPAADLMLGATASGTAAGPFGINLNVAPFSFGSASPITVPLAGSLSRLYSGPTEIGTELLVPIPGISLTVPPGSPVSQPVPGCELSTFFCAVNVTSVTLQITSLQFLNVTGMIYAQNLDAVIPTVPEPTAALLVAGAVVGVLAVARRVRS
jgi:hypothetical protein